MEGICCSANSVPLTPITFLERAAAIFGDRISLVYGNVRFTWRETLQRCTKFASALVHVGISRGDVVAVLAPNVPATYELHFAVPMAGAILCTLNMRHDAAMVSTLLGHSEAKIIVADHQYLHIVKAAIEIMSKMTAAEELPRIVTVQEFDHPSSNINGFDSASDDLEYESLLNTGTLDFEIIRPIDEWDPISLNYTSGTTSRPKGVIYSHRGTYLNTLSTVLLNDMSSMPVYLWTVPMFHCNGWSMTWGVAAQGGTNICQRNVNAKEIFANISLHKVTHMGGAPTVLNMIVNAPITEQKPLPGKVTVMTGGAPPPSNILYKMRELGFLIVHCYGLTETCGVATFCHWKPEWDSLPDDKQAKLKSRQGMQHIGVEGLDIKNPITMESVPADGKTMGEVMIRGNTVMIGYLKDVKATEEAFNGGWFRSGDLGVRHSDGYIELKDRSKDIIISGGENISTIEVESVLFNHPSVLEAAIVGRPDDHWGETPCAFLNLKHGSNATQEEIIKFCRDNLPHYMAPKTVVFKSDLPKSSTGKIQKLILKEEAKAMGSLSLAADKLAK